MSGETEGCHHKNAAPQHDDLDGNSWPVCRMACPCGLRGKGWVYHIDDDSGKANAETEARQWWIKNTSRATPPGYEMVPEGTKAEFESIVSEFEANLLAVANANRDDAWIKGRASLAKGILQMAERNFIIVHKKTSLFSEVFFILEFFILDHSF